MHVCHYNSCNRLRLTWTWTRDFCSWQFINTLWG